LVAAFKATLEELDEADVLVQVVDASDPDFELHISAVGKILEELGLSEKPVVLAFNKIDRLDAEDAQSICESHGAVGLSALDAGTTQPLLRRLDEVLLEHERWAPDEALPVGTVVRIRELAEAGLELEPGLMSPETGLLSEELVL
jgi:GTP-binding protein HflX